MSYCLQFRALYGHGQVSTGHGRTWTAIYGHGQTRTKLLMNVDGPGQ